MRLCPPRSFLQQALSDTARQFDQLGIQLKIGVAQERHAGLTAPDEFTRPAQVQILAGNLETIGVLVDDFQACPRCRRQGRLIEQDAGRIVGAASDAAAQLMQLRETETLGMLDHHQTGVGHIDANLDHRRGHQDLNRSGHKLGHHGRLKADEKAATMAAFAAGEIDVLVATTVIEVGVDVPNASLMVIEHAERFGLSQLHQLRGRVGRGVHDSVCVLLYLQPLSQTARARLKVIFENTDGFEIARQDLHLRGPGEFVGSRQSGVPLLRYADLEIDTDLIELAREMAEHLLRSAPERAERHLQRWLGSREELLKA